MSSKSSSTSILLIEDNKVSQRVLSKLLDQVITGSVEIFTATNSEAALSLFNETMNSLAIIICDGNLESSSKLNGPELTYEILTIQQKYSLNIPIIVWTDDEGLLDDAGSSALDTKEECSTFKSVFAFYNRPFLKFKKPAELQNIKEVFSDCLPENSLVLL